MSGLRADHESRYGHMISTAATMPYVDALKRATHLEFKHLQTPAQVIRRVGRMSGVNLEIERPGVVRGRAIGPWSIGEDRDEMGWSRHACHEVRSIGDDAPVTSLGLVLPVSTGELGWYLLTQPAGGHLVVRHASGPPAQWPE